MLSTTMVSTIALKLSKQPTIYMASLLQHTFSDPSCYHNHFTTLRGSTCPPCNFLYKQLVLARKRKNIFSRLNVSLYNFHCFDDLVEKLNLFLVLNAESTPYNRTECKHAQPFSCDVIADSESPSTSDSRNFCDNAEHILECASSSAQRGGRLFPVYEQGYCWYASCTQCHATCEFTPSATMIPLITFFRGLSFDECSTHVSYRIPGDDERRTMSLDQYRHIQNGTKMPDVEWCSSEGKIDVSSFSKEQEFISYVDFSRSMPQNCTNLECDDGVGNHTFSIWNERGFYMSLTPAMTIYLLILLRGSGYVAGEGTSINGILSIMDLKGVHMRCNDRFLYMHQEFYSGPERMGRLPDERKKVCGEVGLEITNFTTSISPTCVIQMNSSSESETENMEEAPVNEKSEALLAFLNDSESLVFEEESISRTQTRGLGSRIGGVLKAVSNCITKLHAVWDWPLEKAVSIMNDTGDYMQRNNNYVSPDIWSCKMCKEIQEDMTKGFKEHSEVLEVLRESIKRLAQAVDSTNTIHSKVNQNLKEEVEKIKKQLDNLGSVKTPAALPPPRIRHSSGEETAVPRSVASTRSVSDFTLLNEAGLPFEMKLGKNTRAQLMAEYAQKHSGDIIQEAETTSSMLLKESVITSTSDDHTHNLLLAKYHIGAFDWSVSDGEASVISSYNFPKALLVANVRAQDILSYFQYFHCEGLEFEITLTSVAMQGGTLMVTWDNMSRAEAQNIGSIVQLSGLPKLFLHASSDTNAVFTVRCGNLHHQMCLSGSEFQFAALGTLNFSCVNVLNAPTDTAQKVRVNVWAKFLNPSINFMTAKHEITLAQNFSNQSGGFLTNVEAIVARGKWSTTSGVNLCEITVHPCACIVQDKQIYQTPLSIISNAYSRWRGSLVYRIIIGASCFAKGRLRATAIPVQFRKDKLTASQLDAFSSIIFDLSAGEREFSVIVPYYSVASNSLVCRDVLYDVPSYDAELVTTRLHLSIQDALVLNANASNSISYCVTVRAGDDFELLYPSGIKGEFVDRVFAQSDLTALSCRSLLGQGYSELASFPSSFLKITLDEVSRESFGIQVAPCVRGQQPCATLLGWIAQVFTQWSGNIRYTIRAHSFDRTKACYLRMWHDVNGSTYGGDDMEFFSNIVPPAGAPVIRWDPRENETVVEVPYRARTKKLLIPKTLLANNSENWVQCYNGMLMIDLEGNNSIELEIYISGGDNFEFYDQSVAPKCGDVTEAFTKLSFADKLLSSTAQPIFDRARLSGPASQKKAIKAAIKPIEAVKKERREDDEPINKPASAARSLKKRKVYHRDDDLSDVKEGDLLLSDGDEYILRDGEWTLLTAQSHMMGSCIGSCVGVKFDVVNDIVSTLEKHDTCNKVAELVDQTYETFHPDVGTSLPQTAENFSKIIEDICGATKGVKDKIDAFTSMRDRIMSFITPLISSSVPGLVQSCIDAQSYTWATIATVISVALISWSCSSIKKMKKKIAVICMIIWSPFIASKIWDLGVWIKGEFLDSMLEFLGATCRSHLKVDATEESWMGDILTWISENWLNHLQGLLSLFGVITSLVIWGTIPDGNKLNTFASKFKQAGEKGKTISQLSSGLKSAVTLSKDISKWITEWVFEMFGKNISSGDIKLEQIVNFNIREWVSEVRELSLLENKFNDFGSMEYVERVRRLYDNNLKIQSALLTEKIDVQLAMILKECKEKCTELLNDSYSYKGMKKPRIDPIHISLLGAPGVGKSAVAHVLINDLLDSRSEPETDRIFTRCCADAYWSNYHQEPVILYDDLGAIKSSLRLSDYAEIMGIKSNDPYSVPMAIAEEKGKHCLSKYIFSCTNVTFLEDTGDVVTKDAFYRRRNIFVEVSRDPDVLKDPINPTAGLLFTVLHAPNDATCNIKSVWNEDFLVGVDTSNWYFDRVSYSTFLGFAEVYTAHYMASQEGLVKTLNMKSSERREQRQQVQQQPTTADAQMDATRVPCTLKDLVAKFNHKAFTGRDVYSSLRESGLKPHISLKCNRAVEFMEILDSLCDCSRESRDFSCSYWRNDFAKALVSSIKKNKGRSFVPNLRTEKIEGNALESLFSMPAGFAIEKLYEELSPATLVLYLATYLHWDFALIQHSMCPHSAFSKVKGTRVIIDEKDYDYDDIINDQTSIKHITGIRFVHWPSVTKFYPELVEKFQCVAVQDHLGFIRFGVSAQHVYAMSPTKAWDYIVDHPCKVIHPKLAFLDEDSVMLVKAFLSKIDDWKVSPGGINENMKRVCEEALNILDVKSYLIFLLEVHENIYHKKTRFESFIRNNCRNRKLSVLSERYEKYEREVAKGLSANMKIGLAIAGGFVAVGALIGVGLAVSRGCKLIKNIVGGCAKPKTEESFVEITETQVFDDEWWPNVSDVVTMPQMSAADGSDGFKTTHPSKPPPPQIRTVHGGAHMSAADSSDGIKTTHPSKPPPPQIRSIRGTPHMSAADGSDGFKTTHSNKPPPPQIRSVQGKSQIVSSKNVAQLLNRGLGVHYEEHSENNVVNCVGIRRKNKNKTMHSLNFETALKQFGDYMDGSTVNLGEVLKRVKLWQSKVITKGVHIQPDADNSLSSVVCQMVTSATTESGGLRLSSDGGKEGSSEHTDLAVALSKCGLSKNQLDNMLNGGNNIISVKQIRVGAVGMERDAQASQLISSHCLKMICVLYNASNNTQCYVMRLCGSFILCPAHYLSEFEEGHEVYFVSPHKVVRVPVVMERMTLVNSFQDLIVWDLGKNVPPGKNYIEHIPTAQDWAHFRNGEGALVYTKYRPEFLAQGVHFISDIEKISANVDVPTATYETFGSLHTIISGLRYRVACTVGFCGAAIVRGDCKLSRKIVGMHVAGLQSKSIGYAEMLIYEYIYAAVKSLGGETIVIGEGVNEVLIPTALRQCDIPNLGNLGVVGYADDKLIPRVPTHTSIIKSGIHGLFGDVRTEPSILSTFDRRLGEKRGCWDPMLDAVCKYGTNTIPFDDSQITLVESHLIDTFSKYNNSMRKREVNSVEIGINGIDKSDYWLPMEMKTSPGYPYIIQKPAHSSGKSWLFEQDGEYDSSRPRFVMKDADFISSFEDKHAAILKGETPKYLTIECPKDERRKLSKIYDTPATRTFTILPCDINILFRMYFGDFAAMVMSNRGRSFCQVGIDPNTCEWSELMNSLLKVGPKGFAGDYAKFDGIGPAAIYHSIVNIVNAWYDDGPIIARARHCLVSSIVHRQGLAKNWLLQYSQGMPSGFPMTVIFNSFVNYYFMGLAWMNLIERSPLSYQSSLHDFDTYTKLLTYGDDNVVAVDKHFCGYYNLQTVAGYLSSHGITYTDDEKNPIHLSKPHVDITSVTFLKREFVKVDNSGQLWKAPLAKISIEEQCNWVRLCENPLEALAQNVNGALYEAAIHSEEYFDEFSGRLKDAHQRAMIEYTGNSYSVYHKRWWSNMTGAAVSQRGLSELLQKSRENHISLRNSFMDVLTSETLTLADMMQNAKLAPLVRFVL